MLVLVYHKCSTCQKALKWLDEHKIFFEERPIIEENPTYEEVCSDTTDHIEAIQITFDDEVISYEELLNIYWKQIDPTDSGGQFNDRGHKYKTVIFYHDEEQKELAYKSKRELEESKIFNLPIATEILPATVFYEAEDYHQDYYKKNPNHYYRYYVGSGRYFFTKESWDRNNVDRELLKEKLTPIQFEVTQNDKTEPPFKNEFWLWMAKFYKASKRN